MTYDWLRWGSYMAPSWSLTDLCDGVVAVGYVTPYRAAVVYDPSSATIAGPIPGSMDPPITSRFGVVIRYTATGGVPWMTLAVGLDTVALEKVVQGSNGLLYFCGYWLGSTLTVMGPTSTVGFGMGSNKNLVLGCLTPAGDPLWLSHVTLNDPVGILNTIDLACTADGGRVGLFFKARKSLPGQVISFYDAAGTFVGPTYFTLEPTLFLVSVNTAGLDMRYMTMIPPAGNTGMDGITLLSQESSFLVTGVCSGGIGGSSSPPSILSFDGSGTPFFLPVQPTPFATGFLVRCDLRCGFQWRSRIVGAPGVFYANTPISTSSSVVYRYQGGTTWMNGQIVYTGNYVCAAGNQILLENAGGTGGVSFASGTQRGIYIGYMDSSGVHTGVSRFELANTSGSPSSTVLSSVRDPSDQSVYLLLRLTNTVFGGTSELSYFNPAAGAASWTTGLLPTGGYHVLVKCSAAGIFQWARIIGGIGGDQYYGTVILTTEGCPVVFGPFMGAAATVYDGSGAVVGSVAQTGPRDLYLTKWTTDGDFVGIAGFQGSSNDANIWVHSAAAGALYTLFNYPQPLTVTDMEGGNPIVLPTSWGPAFTNDIWGVGRWKEMP
jgi:hypothetical protein